jgi:hypothetical protein
VNAVLDDLVAQTYGDLEIIVVDDGSTDAETTQMLVHLRRPGVRVIHTEHRGRAPALNCAIEHATGEYVSMVVDDYRLADGCLQRAAAVLDDDSAVAFVSGWVERRDGSSWSPRRCDFPELLGTCTVATPALVRRAALINVGGLTEQTPVLGIDDWDLWVNLVERGYVGTILPEVLFHSDVSPRSISGSHLQGDEHMALLRHMITRHESSYRQHVFDLLLEMEAASCDLLKITYELDRDLDGGLVPMIAKRQEELDRLERKLQETPRQQSPEANHERESEETPLRRRIETLEQQLAEYRRELDAAMHARHSAEGQVVALRQSLSWRLTAPLRAALDLARGARGQATP